MSKENRTGAPNMVHIYDVKYIGVSAHGCAGM